MSRVASIVLIFCAVVPAHLSAQYAGSPSDTLRYSELTNGNVEMVMPNGTVTVRSVHDAVLAVTFPSQGRAHAWYEALVVESAGPMGRAKPSTTSLLNQPFEFDFAPTGHIAGLKAPTMPPEIAAITDLTRQFDDFFITVPSSGLSVGTAWADTVVKSKAARDTDKTFSRHIRSYVVERDTSVAGVRAFLIQVSQMVEINTSSEMPEANMSVSAKLTGTDQGWALFAPSLGRLLERQRSGSLKGEMHMQPAGMAPVAIPQSYTYESRIRLRG